MLVVAQARPSERAKFIQKTYLHLAGAVGAFIVVELVLFQLGIAGMLFNLIASNRFMWLLVLGGFALLGSLSSGLAAKADDVNAQYAGLGLYVTGEAILFAPLLYLVFRYYDPNVLPTATILTLLMFAGITTVAFTTRKDFSFLGGALKIVGFLALGLIVCSLIFNFTLGLAFSFLMVAFASAMILYKTSNIMHHYSTEHYVAASLELFAAVALLFWYVLRIVMAMSRR